MRLYIRNIEGSIFTSVKELKDFKKIKLNADETKTTHFIIDKEKLSFYNQQLQWVAEPGYY